MCSFRRKVETEQSGLCDDEGLGRLPNKHFGKHFCRRFGTKILSVFTLELLAKNASVATLALLAVKEYPLKRCKI